jgi:hypothetical protein
MSYTYMKTPDIDMLYSWYKLLDRSDDAAAGDVADQIAALIQPHIEAVEARGWYDTYIEQGYTPNQAARLTKWRALFIMRC